MKANGKLQVDKSYESQFKRLSASLAVVKDSTGDNGLEWSLNRPLQTEKTEPSIHRGQPNLTDFLRICDKWRLHRRKNLGFIPFLGRSEMCQFFQYVDSERKKVMSQSRKNSKLKLGKGPFDSGRRKVLSQIRVNRKSKLSTITLSKKK